MGGRGAGSDVVRRRYQRLAPVYDLMQKLPERKVAHFRRALFERVAKLAGGGRAHEVLELGVGTGRNLGHYPEGIALTAVDFSDRMLARARARARALGRPVRLLAADIEELPFPDASFDLAIGTFVFCSVDDPRRGLGEVLRVLRRGGTLLLLEHVLSSRPAVGGLMRLADPVVSRLSGTHIARRTVSVVERAGFVEIRARPLWRDIVYLIEADAPPAPPAGV